MSRCANGGWMKPIRGIFTALAGIGLALSGVLFATMIVLPARGQEGSSPRRLPSEIIALDVTPLERLPNIPFPMPPELEGLISTSNRKNQSPLRVIVAFPATSMPRTHIARCRYVLDAPTAMAGTEAL